MDDTAAAGIVYNETSGLRPLAGYEQQLKDAREWIARIAIKLKGARMAKSYQPTATEKKYPPAKAAWDECVAAVERAKKNPDPGDRLHFVIWPANAEVSGPTESPKMAASWPYTEKSKIVYQFGPISCPRKVGDVPVSDSVYIFVYGGVK